jgi:hypothetical protein
MGETFRQQVPPAGERDLGDERIKILLSFEWCVVSGEFFGIPDNRQFSRKKSVASAESAGIGDADQKPKE